MKNYSYQEPIVAKVYKELLKNGKAILAASPGAGKTNMAIEIAAKFIKKDSPAKVLILSHNQSILRDQWNDFLNSSKENLKHNILIGGGQIDSWFNDAPVSVTLPSSLVWAKNKLKEIDLLIVDEAHQYYLGRMCQSLLKEMRVKNTLLLTGTPSVYSGHSDFKLYGISIEELFPYGVVCDPLIEIVESDYDYSYGDVKEGEVPAEFLTRKKTISTMDKLLPQLLNKLSSKKRADPQVTAWAEEKADWKSVCKNLKKTMIVCQTIFQAQVVNDYLKKKGVKTILSTSYVMEGNENIHLGTEAQAQEVHEQIKLFKKDPSIHILVVVKRGVLGFNYEDLTNIIDLTNSFSPDRIFQLLCRILRPGITHPKDRKMFIKVTTKESQYITYFVMSFVVAMSLKKYYFEYQTQYRFRDKSIPVSPEFKKIVDEALEEGKKRKDRKLPPLPSLYTFSDIIRKANPSSIRPIAYTTFKEVLKRVHMNRENWSEEVAREKIGKCKTRSELYKRFPSVCNYIYRCRLQHLLDEAYGVKLRWSMEKIKEIPLGFKSVKEFKASFPGAWNWAKKMKRLAEVREHFDFKYQPWKTSNSARRFSSNPSTKLNKKIADEIREEKKTGKTIGELAKKYDVSKSTISYVINNKIWNHDLEMPFTEKHKKNISLEYAKKWRKANPGYKKNRKVLPGTATKLTYCEGCGRKNWLINFDSKNCQWCGVRRSYNVPN